MCDSVKRLLMERSSQTEEEAEQVAYEFCEDMAEIEGERRREEVLIKVYGVIELEDWEREYFLIQE